MYRFLLSSFHSLDSTFYKDSRRYFMKQLCYLQALLSLISSWCICIAQQSYSNNMWSVEVWVISVCSDGVLAFSQHSRIWSCPLQIHESSPLVNVSTIAECTLQKVLFTRVYLAKGFIHQSVPCKRFYSPECTLQKVLFTHTHVS